MKKFSILAFLIFIRDEVTFGYKVCGIRKRFKQACNFLRV